MTFDPDKAAGAVTQAARRVAGGSLDNDDPPDTLWEGAGWLRKRFVRWLLTRPNSISRYLSWYFTFPIEHERKLVEFAITELKNDPEKLLQWENERNLTKMRNKTGGRLMLFLALETLALFTLVGLQGWTASGFKLDPGFFTIFVNATIIQVAGLVLIVVLSLFPRLSKDKHPAEEKVGLLISQDSLKAWPSRSAGQKSQPSDADTKG